MSKPVVAINTFLPTKDFATSWDTMKGAVDSLVVEPDAVMPCQFYTGSAEQEWTPSHTLAAAVLDNALLEYERHSKKLSKYGQPTRLATEVQLWFAAAREDEWPLTFENICSFLRLSASAIRLRLDSLAPHVHFRRGQRQRSSIGSRHQGR